MPFGDSVGDLPILNQRLADHQRAVLEQCGVEIVEEPPSDESYIFFGEEVWFTETLIEELLRDIPDSGNGRLRCTDELWNQHSSSVLSTGDGIFRLGFCFGELPTDVSELPELEMDFQLRDGDPIDLHPKMAHALRPMRVGAMMAFEVKHWCDVLRVNQFAILEKFERVKWQWSQSSFFAKCWTVIATVFKVRSINPQTIARRIGTEGKNCKIHPTAVIEACEIGDNVEIGPYAVVRASVIGDGAKIEEHATVNLSVLGPNSRAARYAMINLCVLMENAFVSRGGGFQMSLYGKGCFIAVDAVMLDLSFGKTIRVLDNDGQWVDSKQHFVGCCIGHRAAIGNAVRLNYGVSVPNDALLVANADELIFDASGAEPNVPARVNDLHGVDVLNPKGLRDVFTDLD